MGFNAHSRRDFLRSLGAGAALLPLLPSLKARAATGTPYPKRTIVIFNGIGTIEAQLWPTATGNTWTAAPGSILEPLMPVQADVNVLRGLNRAYRDDGGTHERATVDAMTGGNPIPGGPNNFGGWAQYPSIDQLIVQKLPAQGTKFPSLQLGVQPNNNGISGTPMTRISYAGYNQPLDPLPDPYAAFEQIFGDFTKTQAQRQHDNQNKLSVLDTLSKSLTKLRTMVSAADYARVDAHTTALRQLETSLQPGGTVAGCAPPTLSGTQMDVNANDNYPALLKLTTDIMVAGLACDTTRVVSLQWSHAFCLISFTWLGITTQHHTLSHQTDDTSINQRAQIQRWYTQQFAYLVNALKSVPEGGGTLLDNTAVFWTNEMVKGDTHDIAGTPVIMAGRGGGYFKTGQYIDSQYTAYHKQVLCSLLACNGITDIAVVGDSYGADKPGPLAAIAA